MRVDRRQLLVVVPVRMRVVEGVGVIHARVQIRAGLILMIEPSVMADLLAHHVRLETSGNPAM